MKDQIKKIVEARYFHIIVFISIISIILFVFGVLSIRYSVEGETNLPFELSKISIISNVEGIGNEDNENKWNITVNQNNDIYLYISKNKNYQESNTEVIKQVILDNFKIEQTKQLGIKKVYKPDVNVDMPLFRCIDDNYTYKIEYKGDLETNLKNMTISNQGDMIVFRYSNTGLGTYISNEDEEINHSLLLQKLNISNEDLNFKLSFNITIELESGKKYCSLITLELPINDIQSGTQSKEITNLNDIIFRRESI